MIGRISRETMLMEMAHIAAKRGTCGRLAVGAILARESSPIAVGYGGAPSGEPHCDEFGCDMSKPCERTLHAEANAIKRARRQGIQTEGADLFSTDSPCVACAEAMIEAKLGRCFFERYYRVTTGIEILIDAKIQVYQLLPNGMLNRVVIL